jgi:hypothetical protein
VKPEGWVTEEIKPSPVGGGTKDDHGTMFPDQREARQHGEGISQFQCSWVQPFSTIILSKKLHPQSFISGSGES